MSGLEETEKTQASDQSNVKENKFRINTHELNNIQKVVAVASGKGGVGKSLVTSLLAVELSRKGKRVGILDADITGPSIPKIFGIEGKAEISELGFFPAMSKNGIKIISVNLLLEQDETPVVWRGPILSGMVKQFWTDVIWGDLDFLLIDMPPGTGDVPLTVFQSIAVDGMIVVASPQDLVALIVKKAYNMAKMMNIPVLGIIENMSYLQCPDCGKQIELFGKSKLKETAAALSIKALGRIPVDPELAGLCDRGAIEEYRYDFLANVLAAL
jgi:Mrp family chromosome partitioning ATPase